MHHWNMCMTCAPPPILLRKWQFCNSILYVDVYYFTFWRVLYIYMKFTIIWNSHSSSIKFWNRCTVFRCLITVASERSLHEPSTTCSGVFLSHNLWARIVTNLDTSEGQRLNILASDLLARLEFIQSFYVKRFLIIQVSCKIGTNKKLKKFNFIPSPIFSIDAYFKSYGLIWMGIITNCDSFVRYWCWTDLLTFWYFYRRILVQQVWIEINNWYKSYRLHWS